MKYIKQNLIWCSALTSALACGGAGGPLAGDKEDQDQAAPSGETGVMVDDEKPEDSTGVMGKLKLAMSTGGQSLALDGDASAADDAEEAAGAEDAATTASATSTSTGVSTEEDGEDDSAEEAAADETTSIATSTATSTSATTSISVGDKLVVTMARFSVAAIKLKAQKDEHEHEKKLKDQEAKEEEQAEKELDAAVAEAAASLHEHKDGADKPLKPVADGDAAGKVKPSPKDIAPASPKKREQIFAKRDPLAQGEKDRLAKAAHHDRSTRFVGPYVYDAVTGQMSGDAPAVDVFDGSYRRVEFKLRRNFEVEGTDPLFGNVFVIQGAILINDESVPFEVAWHSALNFKLVGNGAMVVAPSADNTLAIAFDLDKWFVGVDLSGAQKSEDGVIRINKESNKDLLHLMHKNMHKAARFGKDKNKDGKLEKEETAGEGQESET